jgi:hypothetical protein
LNKWQLPGTAFHFLYCNGRTEFGQFSNIPVGTFCAVTFRMAGVRNHTELEVWKLCDQIRRRVWEFVSRPSFRSHFTLRDQMKDAADSPCPNIAEGFSRYHPRDNAKFVRVAKGSLSELIDHL